MLGSTADRRRLPAEQDVDVGAQRPREEACKGGWATSNVAGWKFATFVPAAPGFRQAVEGAVGEVDWTMPEAHR